MCPDRPRQALFPPPDREPAPAASETRAPAGETPPASAERPAPSEAARRARAYFPRGLAQAEGAFRFSADALLLAAFAAGPGRVRRVLELGTGCGAASFAYLLRDRPPAEAPARGEADGTGRPVVVGLDLHAPSLEAAGANAEKLGLAGSFTPLLADARRIRQEPAVAPEGFDLVLANPPYRRPGTGLVCPGPARAGARFETDGTLDDFLAAAAYALANRGSCALVFLAGRLPDLLAGLAARRLTPRRLRCVHGRADAPARLVLVEARKNGRSELVVEPPLILYEERAGAAVLTGTALAFCPFLACNAERSAPS